MPTTSVTNTVKLTINDLELTVPAGATIWEAVREAGIEIPALCHDPRLKPVGACRTCLGEIDGWRRLAPSCATPASEGMVVASTNDRIERHHKALLALYLSDNVAARDTRDTADPSQLHQMATDVGAPLDWPTMTPLRSDRPQDRNPYVEFRAELPRSPVGRVLKRVLRDEGVTEATWDAEASGIEYEKH